MSLVRPRRENMGKIENKRGGREGEEERGRGVECSWNGNIISVIINSQYSRCLIVCSYKTYYYK